MMMRLNPLTLAAAFVTTAALAASAQQPTVTRTTLQQFDMSIPGREAVTARAEIPASCTTGRHTHPGEEISYVAEGSMTLDVEGAPSRTLKAGDVFFIPAGKVHNATASTKTTIIANYVVEKGKPLASPAK